MLSVSTDIHKWWNSHAVLRVSTESMGSILYGKVRCSLPGVHSFTIIAKHPHCFKSALQCNDSVIVWVVYISGLHLWFTTKIYLTQIPFWCALKPEYQPSWDYWSTVQGPGQHTCKLEQLYICNFICKLTLVDSQKKSIAIERECPRTVNSCYLLTY